MATGKFHINQADGTVGACRAEKGNCPFGSDAEHYTSIVAAAKAFEDSMADQAFTKTAKTKGPERGSSFFFKKHDKYRFKAESLSPEEKASVDELGFPGKNVYNFMRSSVGPAITHREASDVMHYWKKNYDAPGGYQRWEELVQERGFSDEYNTVRDFILSGKEQVYGEIPKKEDYEGKLIKKATDAITASRPYGFPEDEQTRYFMDKAEKAYISAVSELTGDDPALTRQKLLSTANVQRTEKHRSDAELSREVSKLENRIATMKNKNLIVERRKELAKLRREQGIRAVEAASPEDSWAVAARAAGVSQQDALGLIGVPSDEDRAKMDDSTREWWAAK